jgi:hypothetical protein
MTRTSNAMRLAFERATADVPVKQRTRVYAMVRSALSRRVGTTDRKTMWSVQRVRR